MVRGCNLFCLLVLGIVEISFQPKGCEGTPTLYPAEPFYPAIDAIILRSAIQTRNNSSIHTLLTQRVALQRVEIARVYRFLSGNELVKDLGTVYALGLDLLNKMLISLPVLCAKELHAALEDSSNNEDIVSILCTQSENEILEMESSYQILYNKSFISDLTTHDRLMIFTLCVNNRDEYQPDDERKTFYDASSLNFMSEHFLGDVENQHPFFEYLENHSHQQIRATMSEYNRISGESFASVIFRESLNLDISRRDCITLIVNCLAVELLEAVGRVQTKERTITRIILTRSEIDLVEIDKRVQQIHPNGKSIADLFVSGNFWFTVGIAPIIGLAPAVRH